VADTTGYAVIVNEQPRLAKNPCVFAAAVGGGAFNSFSGRNAELNEKMPEGTKRWVPHDLRNGPARKRIGTMCPPECP
jgi:hypothetical protein